MARAAVLHGCKERLRIEDVDVAPPGPYEVEVRLAASGVCHSDLLAVEGKTPVPTPIVLGHEAAGVVARVGDGVTRVAPGDHVILSAVPQCGTCWWCTRGEAHLCGTSFGKMGHGGQLDGTSRFRNERGTVYQYGFAGTFIETTVAPEASVVKIPEPTSMVAAALIGCAVTTGIGAARRTAEIAPGDSVAVLGCGGVGLNVVQGAKLCGADPIIAVDIRAPKLDLARRLGATDGVDARTGDPVEKVHARTGGRGADVTFELTGLAEQVDVALRMTRPGGQLVIVAIADPEAVLPVRQLASTGRIIRGCRYGSTDAGADFPRLLAEYEQGLIDIDALVSQRIDLTDVNDAFEQMKAGEVTRSVIVYPSP